tara:strand:+ start:1220 stop:1348 length:129 start_codon:yes stop_codon:yes gene_type:complete
MRLLEFIFQSGWTFFGFAFLLMIGGSLLVELVKAIGNIFKKK